MCGSFFSNFYLGGDLTCLFLRVHLWTDQRIPSPVSCRCPGGSLETPPRWHATMYSGEGYKESSFFFFFFVNSMKLEYSR